MLFLPIFPQQIQKPNLRLTFEPSEDTFITFLSSREVEHSLKLSYTSWAVAFPVKHDVVKWQISTMYEQLPQKLI